MMRSLVCVIAVACLASTAVAQKNSLKSKTVSMTAEQLNKWAEEKGLSSITLGAGCFWCTEASIGQLEGVEKAVSGYANGHVKNPTYEQICTGKTGHVEVAQIFYDAKVISLDKILQAFFVIHDPTSLDRQGADAGPQYRSVIYYNDEKQKEVVDEAIAVVSKAVQPDKVVTVVEPLKIFYPAEDYHQEYFKKNPQAGYCQAVVREKVEKIRKAFKSSLKTEAK